MSGYHFKFAFSAEGNSASFAFEFSASNGCAFVNEENNLQLEKTKKYSLKSAEMTIKDNIIAWKADKESKFCDCIAFNIGENIGLEFINGDRFCYLYRDGGVTPLRKEQIKYLVLKKAEGMSAGAIQCSVRGNALGIGEGEKIFSSELYPTHPLNDDIEEIAELLRAVGVAVETE